MGRLENLVLQKLSSNIQIKYGTAGFRDLESVIINISKKIGIALSILSEDFNDKIGIMITASHNPPEHNGVKIVDHNGEMIPNHHEKLIERIINSDINIFNSLENVSNKPFTLIIGHDTRKSCSEIIKNIIEGAKKIRRVNVKDFGMITTPELHYLASSEENNYLEILNKTKLSNKIKVDCAGGVGYVSLQKLNHPSLKLYCTPETNILNTRCGSDYVFNNKKLPENLTLEEGEIGCSLDGDGDRLIFYFLHNKELCILDGDYIMVLWAIYLKKIFSKCVVVTTPYCNRAIENYLKDNDIEVIFRATGVKNLHHEAKNHDIAVYFETNGHGTALCQKELNEKFVLNQLVGDGIYNIFTTIQILEELNLSMIDWYEMVKKNPFINFSVSKENLPDIKCNEVGDKIIKPAIFQKKIDELSNKYNAKIFARPSGTEPIIRIYVESKENIDIIKDELSKYFIPS